MLLSFLVAPGAMLAVGLADSVAWIAVGTAVLGFFTDLYRPAVSAAITDIVPSADRPRAFGYLYWAINVGAAIAPVAAGLLARTNYLLLFVGDALTTFLFGLIVLWGVRETRPAELEGRLSTPVGERVRALWAEPVLLAFTGLALLFGTIYAQGHVTLPVDMSAHGLTPEQYGLAVALNGALIVVLGIPASNVAPRWPRFGALAIAGLLLGIGFGLPAIVTTFGGYALSVGSGDVRRDHRRDGSALGSGRPGADRQAWSCIKGYSARLARWLSSPGRCWAGVESTRCAAPRPSRGPV